MSRLKQVVLPAPFGPISAWIVPRRTARSTFLTATKPLNSLVSPCVERIVSSAIGRCPGRPRARPIRCGGGRRLSANGPAKSNARAPTGQRRVPSQRCAFCVASNCAGLVHAGGIRRGKGDQQQLRGGVRVAERVMADRDVATEMGDPFVEAVTGRCPETAPEAGTRGRRTAAPAARRASSRIARSSIDTIELGAKRDERRLARIIEEIEHRVRAGRGRRAASAPPMPWIRMLASALACACRSTASNPSSRTIVPRCTPTAPMRDQPCRAVQVEPRRLGVDDDVARPGVRQRRGRRAAAAARRRGDRPARRPPSGPPNRKSTERARSSRMPARRSELIVVRKPLLQLARLAKRLLQHPLVHLVQRRPGRSGSLAPCAGRMILLRASAAAAGSGTHRSAPRRGAARRACCARPRAGVPPCRCRQCRRQARTRAPHRRKGACRAS